MSEVSSVTVCPFCSTTMLRNFWTGPGILRNYMVPTQLPTKTESPKMLSRTLDTNHANPYSKRWSLNNQEQHNDRKKTTFFRKPVLWHTRLRKPSFSVIKNSVSHVQNPYLNLSRAKPIICPLKKYCLFCELFLRNPVFVAKTEFFQDPTFF